MRAAGLTNMAPCQWSTAVLSDVTPGFAGDKLRHPITSME